MQKTLADINTVIVVLLTMAYFFQIIYTGVGLFSRRKPEPAPAKMNKFAALICARNEAMVIAELVDSLKKQNYPAEMLDVYVLADNCTDDTAARAAEAGAIVLERQNRQQVGKGYALDFLLKRIMGTHRKNPYDGYFIFDADNIVDPAFTAEMNKTFNRGYDAVTCYRNSKNFGANWISAGYSIWFLREARFLNYPRMRLGSGCAVSGTGFLVSHKIIEQNGGWPFHLLTEDIQFSVQCAIAGHKIGYCDGAMIYDEQPTSFRQSWLQRLRWSKGFYQVNAQYLPSLIKGTLKHKTYGTRMTCYDLMMTIIPCTLLTVAVLFLNVFVCVSLLTLPHAVTHLMLHTALRYIGFAALNFYVGMLSYGMLTVASEWRRIPASAWQKIKYIWAFPLFIATYVPITLMALWGRVEWTHIQHHSSAELALYGARRQA